MVRARAGSIIFIGSISPFIGVPGQANYAAAKAGLVGLARALAKEVAIARHHRQRGRPRAHRHRHDRPTWARRKDAMAAMIPMGRIGQPTDIAGVVGFLASNDARYITGAVLARRRRPRDGPLRP